MTCLPLTADLADFEWFSQRKKKAVLVITAHVFVGRLFSGYFKRVSWRGVVVGGRTEGRDGFSVTKKVCYDFNYIYTRYSTNECDDEHNTRCARRRLIR